MPVAAGSAVWVVAGILVAGSVAEVVAADIRLSGVRFAGTLAVRPEGLDSLRLAAVELVYSAE